MWKFFNGNIFEALRKRAYNVAREIYPKSLKTGKKADTDPKENEEERHYQ